MSYLLGHYLKGASCTLCDITHSPFRRKASWDAAVARLGIPFDLLHLNELDPELAVFVGEKFLQRGLGSRLSSGQKL